MKTLCLTALIVLSGCSLVPAKPPNQVCVTTKPIRLTDDDINCMSADTARQNLNFNKTRKELCGDN